MGRPIIRLLTWLCLVLLLQIATAQSFQVVGRQNDGTTSVAPTSAEHKAQPTTTTVARDEEGDSKKDGKDSEDKTDDSTATKSSAVVRSTTSSEPSSTHISTNGNLDGLDFLNSTIPDGQLPLAPSLTPGWGVAGAIMLTTGAAYTLIGIKIKWVHTFFSSAYLAALGICVLIVYIMKTPLSDSLQGGYTAATIVPACVLGAASVFFRELTEGLACALGGFCLSMWLLCLVPGGLIAAVASKAIFIACFTVVGLAFYFSRYTRDWAMIIMISFGGATVTVLGIDCFSRAGLKEFWAYIWELNDNLFPLGADTYPVTKGIRVETAAVIIFFLFGVVSQIKLWRIVREQKEKRAADRAVEQRDLEQQEADVGRNIEDLNARERQEWERVHGDGTGGLHDSQSSLGDGEKKTRSSSVPSSKSQDAIEVFELADMSESDRGQAPAALMEERDKEGKVTIRVAEDDTLPAPVIGDDGFDEKTGSRRVSRAVSMASNPMHSGPRVNEPPEVVPLPFTIPQDEEDVRSRGGRSSVATFAGDEGIEANDRVQAHRQSLAKRLSQSSGQLLRSFSQRSRHSARAGSRRLSDGSEDMVIEKTGPKDRKMMTRKDSDCGSIAATADYSETESERRMSRASSERGQGARKSIEITAELADRTSQQKKLLGSRLEPDTRPVSMATVSTGILATDPANNEAGSLALPDSKSNGDLSTVGEATITQSEKLTSIKSGVSTTVTLTRDHLPESLSRVALSYRTNEWAKHLSHADAPQMDQLSLGPAQSTPKADEDIVAESSVPVNVQELQRTAEEGVPTAAATRNTTSGVSDASTITPTVTVQRSDSRTSFGGIPRSNSRGSVMSFNKIPLRSASQNAFRKSSSFQTINEAAPSPLRSPTILEEGDLFPQEAATAAAAAPSVRLSSSLPGASAGMPIPGVVSYDSPQTLMGQRDMFLRSRSKGNLHASPSDMTLNSGRPLSIAASDAGSLLDYPMYAAALDADDVPLSQRKEFMRQNSMKSLTGQSANARRLSSAPEGAINTNFNSHQPVSRNSSLPTEADRQARLASFRSSIAQDLRGGTTPPSLFQSSSFSSSRDTPFGSTQSLLAAGRDADMQRNIMMGQQKAESQQKELARRQKEWADRAADERMRSGDMLQAHQDAMRRMQKGAREG